MPVFERSSWIAAPVETVFSFHERPDAFKEHTQNGARRETVPGSSGGARRTLCAFKEHAQNGARRETVPGSSGRARRALCALPQARRTCARNTRKTECGANSSWIVGGARRALRLKRSRRPGKGWKSSAAPANCRDLSYASASARSPKHGSPNTPPTNAIACSSTNKSPGHSVPGAIATVSQPRALAPASPARSNIPCPAARPPIGWPGGWSAPNCEKCSNTAIGSPSANARRSRRGGFANKEGPQAADIQRPRRSQSRAGQKKPRSFHCGVIFSYLKTDSPLNNFRLAPVRPGNQ